MQPCHELSVALPLVIHWCIFLLTDKMKELYTTWFSEGEKTYTASGNMRSPTKDQLVRWVKEAWEWLSADTIAKSFKTCGITTALDGSENDLILCMRGEANDTARDLLYQACHEDVPIDVNVNDNPQEFLEDLEEDMVEIC